MKFGDRIIKWFLLLLVVLFVLTSYYRFLVIHDYSVGYETECDPYTQTCFVGCEDDECTSEYYYSKINKYAPNLFEQCGNDITDCEKAHKCLPEDGTQCTITFCNSEINDGTCEDLTEDDYIEENDPAENVEIVSETEIDRPQEEGNIENSNKTNEIIENI